MTRVANLSWNLHIPTMAYHIKFGSIEVNCARVQTCIRGSRKETVVLCISKSNDTSTHKAAEKIRPRVSPFWLVWLAYSQPLTNLPPPTMGCCAKVVSSTMSGVLGRKRADELGYPPSHWNQEPLLVKIRKEHPGWAWGEQVRGLWFFPSVLWLGDRKCIPLENIMSVGYVGGDDLTGALHVLQLQSSSPSPSSLLQGSPE